MKAVLVHVILSSIFFRSSCKLNGEVELAYVTPLVEHYSTETVANEWYNEAFTKHQDFPIFDFFTPTINHNEAFTKHPWIMYIFLLGSYLGKICGRTYGSGTVEDKLLPQAKIVGGFDVGYYKYPWYAALVTSNIVACGGTLIGSKTVVSAAHCFKEYIVTHDAKKTKLEDVYNVTLGIYNRCQKEKSEKTFFMQKVYVHEKYKDNIPYYDISVIVLKESTNAYQPICLPKGPVKNKPREGSVPGLGTLRYHGSTPCTLHEARLLTYSDLECRKMINRTGNDPKKLYRAFCAGYLQGGIDTCQGDSGGPFQIVDEFGNFILLGVVSFGFHCANPNLLGVYTDVSQYVDWIEQKAGFNATMEGPSNTTEGPAVGEEPSASAEHSPKPVKKPQQVHYVHAAGVPSVNIFILREKDQRKRIMPVAEKKIQTDMERKRKSKRIKTKTKKKPKL